MPRRAPRHKAAKARVAVARDVDPDVLLAVFDVACDAVASFRRLAVEAHGHALADGGPGPARNRRKVELRNPGRYQLSTAIQDALLAFLKRASSTPRKRASSTPRKRASSESTKGAGESESDPDAAESAASGGGSGAMTVQPPPRSATVVDVAENEEAGGAGPVHDDAPLSSNEEALTRIGFFVLDTGAGSPPEQGGQAGTLTKRQLLRRRRSGARRGAMEDLNRRVAEEAAKVKHLLHMANNLTALLRTAVPDVASTGGGTSTDVGPVRVSRESDPTTPDTTAALDLAARLTDDLLASSRKMQAVSDKLAAVTRANEDLTATLTQAPKGSQSDIDSLQGVDTSGGFGDGAGGVGGSNEVEGLEPDGP